MSTAAPRSWHACLLLWSLFLPLNRYWSVDAALDRESPGRPYPMLPFLALRLQVSSLYFFSALFKLEGEPWRSGYALGWALQDTFFGARPAGLYFVHEFPSVLYIVNYLVIAFQIAFPYLIYCPWGNDWTRAFALAGSIAMHVSFLVFLSIGGFPYLCLIMLLVLVPDQWIDRLFSATRPRLARVSGFLGRRLEMVPRAPSVLRSDAVPGRLALATNGMLAALALVSNVISLDTWTETGTNKEIHSAALLGQRRVVDEVLAALQVRQVWALFAPVPTHSEWTIEFLAFTEMGAVDFTTQVPAVAIGSSGAAQPSYYYWTKYFEYMDALPESGWAAFGSYLCRVAGVSLGKPVAGVDITIGRTPVRLPTMGAAKSTHREFKCQSEPDRAPA